MKSYRPSIKHFLQLGQAADDIASRVYGVYPARAFELLHGYDLEFEIKNEVSAKLNVPLTQILMCGSAQLGESIHASKEFDPSRSDLDLALVDADSYLALGALAQVVTRDFQDLTKFPKLAYVDDVPRLYKDNFSRGFIHLFTLPLCDEKRRLMKIFDELTRNHQAKFSSISCSVYATLEAFKRKQAETIRLVL